MNSLLLLIPVALLLGGLGLLAFFWALRGGQFDDPDGDAARILVPDDGDNIGDRSLPADKDAAEGGK